MSTMKAPNSFVEALLNRDLKTAKELLIAGADVGATYGPDGWTALHYMAENGVTEAVCWLLEHGADVNARNTSGWTPLHLSIDSEGDFAQQQFVEKGVPSLSGEVTKLLLQRGADPNAKTFGGKTPLNIALAFQHTVAVEELRRYGAADVS
jgi:ankyrin repeat protein